MTNSSSPVASQSGLVAVLVTLGAFCFAAPLPFTIPWVGPTGVLSALFNRAPKGLSAPMTPFDPSIEKAAEENNLDPLLVKAVISVESSFNPKCVSPAGARGLMQLIPLTARRLGVHHIFNPEENIRAGCRHLRYLIDKYSGDLKLALAAYNAGEGSVHRYKGIPPYRETQAYVKRVLSTLNTYQS